MEHKTFQFLSLVGLLFIPSTVSADDDVQALIHQSYRQLADAIVLKENLGYQFEIVDRPGAQNAWAVTYPSGKREIRIDEMYYARMPWGQPWGMIFVLGHEIGHFHFDDGPESKTKPTTEQKQLAADYFAGRIAADFGETLAQTTWVLRDYENQDPGNKEWDARIKAVTRGWLSVRCLAGVRLACRGVDQ